MTQSDVDLLEQMVRIRSMAMHTIVHSYDVSANKELNDAVGFMDTSIKSISEVLKNDFLAEAKKAQEVLDEKGK